MQEILKQEEEAKKNDGRSFDDFLKDVYKKPFQENEEDVILIEPGLDTE